MNSKSVFRRAAFGAFYVFTTSTNAYEPVTHELISIQAVLSSMIFDGKKLTKSAIPDFDDLDLRISSSTYPNSEGATRNIALLVSFGSRWEDDRSLLNGTRHFFNPLNGQGLSTRANTFISSPDWILGDRGVPDHQFTWNLARTDFLRASIDPDKAVRKQRWGLVFQKIGHVIHHIQDMAQPQHSRNDAHCGGYCLYLYPTAFYEAWTRENGAGVVQPFINSSYPVVYPSPSKAINSTRDFWTASGRGMADFANANFVSSGTNFIGTSDSIGRHPAFPLPFAARFNRRSIAELQSEIPSVGIAAIASECLINSA